MSRAYDEIGAPEKAMEVMDRFVSEYPYSRYVDEVQFRRGEFFFVRREFRSAESAYTRVVNMGEDSSFYELSRYKLGWTLYKQQFYDEALDNFIALLDYRQSIGFDFDQHDEGDEEHRVTDTYRVISLSFSNLGGPEIIDEYFSEKGPRSYGDKIYSNLGEFFFEKLRYDDAASVYRSFVDLHPYHEESPTSVCGLSRSSVRPVSPCWSSKRRKTSRRDTRCRRNTGRTTMSTAPRTLRTF
jgi:tetratricopeptide (TPR) repeat protein